MMCFGMRVQQLSATLVVGLPKDPDPSEKFLVSARDARRERSPGTIQPLPFMRSVRLNDAWISDYFVAQDGAAVAYTLKLSPQPQLAFTFGLLILKPVLIRPCSNESSEPAR